LLIGSHSKACANKKTSSDGIDTIYVELPMNYDTVDVRFLNPNITSFVADRWHLQNFKAPGAMSFDFAREADFKVLRKEIPYRIRMKIIDFGQISDILILYKRDFFKRHIFYVVISKNDTCFFYHAKGEYMYKNFDNDVQYDTTKQSAIIDKEIKNVQKEITIILFQKLIIYVERLCYQYEKDIAIDEVRLLQSCYR